jgi:16S rRNA (cytosine967-C5)-methyltransferase
LTVLDQVAQLLAEVLRWAEPADVLVSKYFRANANLGARDRGQIAQAVFDVLRHLRRYRHDAQSEGGSLERALAVRGLFATLSSPWLDRLLDAREQQWAARLSAIDAASLPFGLRYSLPDWIQTELQTLEQPDSYAQALLEPAPLDLRVNRMKAERDTVMAQLTEQLQGSEFQAEPTPYSPDGIRLTGHPPVNRWSLFEQGLIEVQDEGSQLLAHIVAPKRGEMVIDFCAGAGGKTLALGAMMRSTGRLYAFDVSAHRLARAKPRLARSGLSQVHSVVIRHERDDRVVRLKGKAHRVLVDAPCTGLGTLRRNPDLKWRQSPQVLARLCEQQASILAQSAQCLRPGGRLVYATCSFLRQENEDQVQQFLENNPDFSILPATECLPEHLSNAVTADGFMRLRPDWHGTDGFFAAILQRKS